jgi:hypothetical protein
MWVAATPSRLHRTIQNSNTVVDWKKIKRSGLVLLPGVIPAGADPLDMGL